jgi:hypothetical protein
MEYSWNDNDSEKLKNSKKNLSQCHFSHPKPHKDWPGINPLAKEASNLTA